MRTFDSVSNIRAFVRASVQDGKSIALVPTMGALHEGHMSLMRRARADCDLVIASIFVNPSQFGANEDFDRYPRDLARDSKLAQQAGVDALFTPSVKVIYPEGDRTTVQVGKIAERWEGELRPGHFEGVATVCAKLFQIVNPDRVYFGLKDYQQLKVIEQMSADLFFAHTIVPVATVREPDGLAMSSRNVYLSEEERQSATAVSRALALASQQFDEGERNAPKLQEVINCTLQADPAVTIQYTSIADADTLEPLETVKTKAVALIAVKVGTTRLIDNAVLGGPPSRRGENDRSKG